MPRVVLLVNPVAGAGRGLAQWPGIERALSARGPVTVIEPFGEQALATAAREAAADGYIIVVAGGDGTINRVVRAIGRVPVPIGLIPLGSGNDLARALGVPRDPVRAAERIAASAGVLVDLVEVNGEPCCTVGGVGLVADVTADVARLARPGRLTRPVVRGFGPHAYLLAAACRLSMPNTRAWHASVEGTASEGSWRWSGPCHAVFVANFPLLGAGLALPVESSAPNDGHAELCIVPRRSRVSLAFRLAALRSGRPQPESVLTVRRAIRASIDVEHEMAFAADGDVVCVDRRFEVSVRARALTVLC